MNNKLIATALVSAALVFAASSCGDLPEDVHEYCQENPDNVRACPDGKDTHTR